MGLLQLISRKIGVDDIAWGTASFSWVDENGVSHTMQQVNIPSLFTLVQTFNGRSGVVVPVSGDYTATQVGLGNVTNDAQVKRSEYTAKGKILVGTGAGTFTALTVGSNEQTLVADTTQASGVKWASVGGKLLQEVTSESGSLVTNATTIPADNTIPQITEGSEYMTLAITPQKPTSTLIVEAHLNFGMTVANHWAIAALFNTDLAVNNALTANAMWNSMGIAQYTMLHLHKTFPAHGLSVATTFRVRAGTDDGSALNFNGQGGVGLFNGTNHSTLSIREVAV